MNANTECNLQTFFLRLMRFLRISRKLIVFAEELKKQRESKTKECEVTGGEEASTSNPTQRTERIVNRLSGLLNRIRNRGGTGAVGGTSKNRKKPRTDKEHRIQIR